jgi:hypothetical protein
LNDARIGAFGLDICIGPAASGEGEGKGQSYNAHEGLRELSACNMATLLREASPSG